MTPETTTVVPAAPGTLVIYLDEADDGTWTLADWSTPVIAWSVSVRAGGDSVGAPTCVYPVTIDGNNLHESANKWAIQYPDGAVDDIGIGWFKDARAWLKGAESVRQRLVRATDSAPADRPTTA